jgi:predicted DNA-binding protein
MKRFLLRLPVGMAERIDALVGTYRRTACIREVLERAVVREERRRERLAQASAAKSRRS